MTIGGVNQNAHTDVELAAYMGDLSPKLRSVRLSKAELSIWWNHEGGSASEVAREIRREHSINDSVVRSALRKSIVVDMYSILKDNQSKCFNSIEPLFGNGILGTIITNIYAPLWNAYQTFFASDINRLSLNRNNLDAHTSRNHPIADVLYYPDYVAARFPMLPKEHFESSLTEKHQIITREDIISDMLLFSDSSLNYLDELTALLYFAQIPEIKASLENNIPNTLSDFAKQHPLVSK